MTKKSLLKTKRITTADLILNNIGAPISSIKINSTDLSKKELIKEISRRFGEVLSFRYYEEWVEL